MLSPSKRFQKKQSKKYSTVLLYNSGDAMAKLNGLTIAACNPTSDQSHLRQPAVLVSSTANTAGIDPNTMVIPSDAFTLSDRKSCNTCAVEFEHRNEQKEHFKSDWHRYNLQQKIKGRNCVTVEQFEDIIGNISSISGSETDSDDEDPIVTRPRPRPLLTVPVTDSYSSNESDVESSKLSDEQGRKYPKIFFRNADGDLISVYRCVVQHKKSPPNSHSELVSMVTEIPRKVIWAVFMASGGHFAGAIFNRDQVIVQKTFHRYVVRAKRGTAQGSRDSQGNAPKSAGASLRRYNEAALKEDIQSLLSSWGDHMTQCDLIFLRAPSFNKKIFFSGKTPPLKKDDERIRMIPFPTKRPTHNEVRRVHQMLASIECYGEESEIQDHVPLSPPLTFNPEKGLLEVMSTEQMSSRHKKLFGKSRTSPLVTEESDKVPVPDSTKSDQQSNIQVPEKFLSTDSATSSNVSTASESEMVESQHTISTSNLKEFDFSKKPKRKKKSRKRRLSKHQVDPEADVFAEEKYHLKNSLYTAVKVGDVDTLKNLLAIFSSSEKFSSNDLVSMETPTNEKLNLFSHENNSDSTSLHTDNQRNVEVLHHNRPSTNESSESLDILTPTDDIKVLSLRETSIERGDQKKTSHSSISSDGQQSVDNGLSSNITSSASSAKTKENAAELNLDININSSVSPEGKTEDKILKEKSVEFPVSNDILSPVVTVDILNEPIGDNEKTLLHVACKEGHRKIVKILLEMGADPAIKDKYGTPPYISTNDKEVRNEFRRFMANFPDRYDYKVAQVPSPLTPEMEQERKRREADRKKVQKKAKQERDKIKRAEEAVKEAEEREKKRFLSLSDREKRALAAERRLLQLKAEKGEERPVISRCFQCGADMTGKTPFEYYDYKFCASKCLKEHRMKEKKS